MKKVFDKIFHNNYAMAVISIILIVLIVAISLNFNPQTISNEDNTGQAYLQSINDPVLKVENSPAMTKVYVESKPEVYAYLRDK